jgi:hypothetical protein
MKWRMEKNPSQQKIQQSEISEYLLFSSSFSNTFFNILNTVKIYSTAINVMKIEYFIAFWTYFYYFFFFYFKKK